MNSKLAQKCVSVLACLGIVFLIAVLAVVWIQFYQGSFRGSTLRQNDGRSRDVPMNYTVPERIAEKRMKPKLKDSRDNSYIGNSSQEGNVEYVKPMKISPLPLHDHDIIFNKMNNYSDESLLPHHSGHFRHSSAEVWDPHPHYEIDAFGKKFKLQLAHDSKFISPNLYISHALDNYTYAKTHDPRMLGCFYSGNVQGDVGSDVVVSLCNGMTGYIRTSEGSYNIEPVEYTNGTLNSFLHRIKKFPTTSKEDNEVIAEDNTIQRCGTNITEQIVGANNEIPDQYPIALDLHEKPSKISSKRYTAKNATIKPVKFPGEDMRKRKKRDVENDSPDDGFEEWDENRQYFIKVLVVADKSMVDFFNSKDELHRYILTLMSQTARLYKESSIGNAITLSVTEMRTLANHSFEASAYNETLSKFCKWKEKYLSRPNHDVALLLTRYSLCGKKYEYEHCEVLGVARLGSICTPRSCAVAVDNGLSTAYTIAHEIGHTLNIPHDSEPICERHKGNRKSLMSTSFVSGVEPWMWSPCSKYHVTEFLGSKKAKCLLRPPITNIITTEFSVISPGEKYGLEEQCELEFGKGKKPCPFYMNGDICQNLWCSEDGQNECATNYYPLAEGTICGDGRRCNNGRCISYEEHDLTPIAGGWSSWSELKEKLSPGNFFEFPLIVHGVPHGYTLGTSALSWGSCSRTCGGGVKMSQRLCDNPTPRNGGDYCSGSSVRYGSCNTEACPDNVDFRAVQCAEHNGNRFYFKDLPKDVKWLPKYGLGRDDQCKLYCRAENSTAYYDLKAKVIDGTKCGFNSFGICVDGKCRPGGCDNKLYSQMEKDACGVCGGDNSQCEEISGTYNITALAAGYNTILKFPRGSLSLDIKQKDRPDVKWKNYLALVDGDTGNYILNGMFQREQPKDIVFGGSIIKYSGSNVLTERITTGKNEILTKPLVLEILTIDSRSPPPDVTYRYIISKENAPRYSWRLYQKEWSECNSICSGYQFMKPVCIETGNEDQIVDDYFCASKDTHGIIQKNECNNHCRLIWNPIKRGECSTKCGTGVREVTYNCMKIDNEREKYGFFHTITADSIGDIIPDHFCNMLAPPQKTEACYGNCNYRWHYSDWSQCSQTCGGGVQTRIAKCVDEIGSSAEEDNCKELGKITQRECKNSKCPEWHTTEWSKCSEECGRGYKTRVAYCRSGQEHFKNYFCDPFSKPKEKIQCILRPCVQWATGDWSTCSSTCGNGIQTREVYCRTKEDQRVLDLTECSDILRPNATRICHLKACQLVSQPIYAYPPEGVNNNSIQVEFKGVEDKWVTGAWSQCSKSCGGGMSSRSVICRGDQGLNCDQAKKPVSHTYCNTFRCPQWQSGEWSQCDESCEKHRLVKCRNYSGSIVPDLQCSAHGKPIATFKCKVSQCPHLTNSIPTNYFDTSKDEGKRYIWKVGNWKECSSRCGKGKRYRNVTCQDTLYDVDLVDGYCQNSLKPKTYKLCERFRCSFTWIESEWSQCSEKCGNGIKSRNVTCHKVHPGGLIDPNPMPDIRFNKQRRNYCEIYKKPISIIHCKESNCGDLFVWRTGPWKQCSHECGRKGRQSRQLYCINSRNGSKMAKRFCPKSFRPRRKRKCNQWRCAHKSCRDVKNSLQTSESKEYLLDLHGKKAVIYCFKMDTREPEEYISLMNDIQNYAELYDKRLVNLDSCPFNGARNDSCDCIDVGRNRSGLTRFYKVRLNITTMKIIGEDFTFTTQTKGKKVPYGSAGDCYSRAESCGQGRFSIDLTGTSFKLSSNVSWIGAITRIHRTDQTVTGKCGGFCGDCLPDDRVGLQVEIT